MGKKFAEYSKFDLSEINKEVLKKWDENQVFAKSMTEREGCPSFVFFEGPPSANGMPGIHHVMARSIKDIFCRYKTMKGFQVKRKAGWDTHGLPVELGVEKALGITKEDIGKTISVAEYNAACRKDVMKFTKEWEDLTHKMGYWVDMQNPYITYDNRYIETLWWLLKQLHKKGLLYKGYTIQPYSPAAGTGLSSHELNQPGCYRDVKDTTVVGQFKMKNPKPEMADMGYGLLMIFLPLLYLKKARPPESKRGFIELILWCGIVTFIFGALTGGFFGDFIPQLCKVIDPASTFELPSLFSPLNDTMAIMVGSMVLGGIQILTGMTISVVKKTKDGHFADALWDEITWWVILAGGAMALLKVGSVAGVPVVLVIGMLMLVYGSGRGKKGFGKVTGLVSAVYNGVTGFFSDILSYVRLMALMLSGAVLAQVFNMLGATTGNVVGFVVIALIGNALNLALNLLGCYVHDMRLQFLEFFGRFYKEGGKSYRPLSVETQYVEVMKEDN